MDSAGLALMRIEGAGGNNPAAPLFGPPASWSLPPCNGTQSLMVNSNPSIFQAFLIRDIQPFVQGLKPKSLCVV
jgi:hypothetical protein